MKSNQRVSNIEERYPKIGRVLNKKELSNALEKINWTSELKDGRVAHIYESAKSLLKQRSVINLYYGSCSILYYVG